MIVARWTHNVKMGRMEEAVTLHLAEAEKIGHPHPFRVYTSGIGRLNVLAIEIEFESLEKYEKFWPEWRARPETDAFLEKLNDLREPGSIQEIWNLAG